jgi:hypothetical protein
VLKQVSVHGLHAQRTHGPWQARDLVGLALANQVGDRRRRHQDLAGRDESAAAVLLARHLGDDAAQRLAQHGPDLRLLLGRELVDDAIELALADQQLSKRLPVVCGPRPAQF